MTSSDRDRLQKEWNTDEEIAPQRVPKEELENEERELNAEPERAVRAGRRLYEKTKEAVGPSFEQSEPDDPRETENKPYPSQNHAVRDLRRAFKEPDIRASVEKKSRLAPVFTDAPGDGSLGEGLQAWGDTARIEKVRFAPTPAPPVVRSPTVRAPRTVGVQNAVEPSPGSGDFSDIAAAQTRERIELNRAKIADLSPDRVILRSLDGVSDTAELESIHAAERQDYDRTLGEVARDPAKRQRYFNDQEVAGDVARESGDPLAAQKFLSSKTIAQVLAERARRLLRRRKTPQEPNPGVAPIEPVPEGEPKNDRPVASPEFRPADDITAEEMTELRKTFDGRSMEWIVYDERGRRRRKRLPVFVSRRSRYPSLFDAEAGAPAIGGVNIPHLMTRGDGAAAARRQAAQKRMGFTRKRKDEIRKESDELVDIHEYPAASTNEILLIDPDYGFVGPIPYRENRRHGNYLRNFYRARQVKQPSLPFLYLLAPVEDGYGP